MVTKWFAMLTVAAMVLVGSVRADDTNADVAKAIAEIAARRAEKVEARVKQVATWAQGEGRESQQRGGFSRGGLNVAPGAAINPAPTTLKLIEKK